MRRPRFLVAIVTVLLLIVGSLPVAGAPDDWNLNSSGLVKVNIMMDGRTMDFSGYIVNNRTVAPLRAIFEALSVDVKWNPDTYTITATKGNKVIVLTVGKAGATIDGTPYEIAVPPVLIDSRTFVPVRFIIDALGLDVKWDANTYTVIINSGSECTLAPFQRHEGTIAVGGETWGKCGSPHIVSGTFYVEGTDSPILTIEPGAVLRFEANSGIEVGGSAPGGLVVNGKDGDPVYFTADTSGPQAGFWDGIHFFNQTLINDSRIANAVIEYAGEAEGGAITIEGYEKMVEVQLNNVEIKHSQYAGLNMKYQGRLRAGSAGLTISDTEVAAENGGFPIITGIYGSHNLPWGTFEGNAVNAVAIDDSGYSTVATNTTWKNVSIPYAINDDVYVEGKAAPTLTIAPGVITLWAPSAALFVGDGAPGHLVADAGALVDGAGEGERPEGGGEWKSEFDPDTWTKDPAKASELASVAALEPGCALCGVNQSIIFGAWTAAPERGAWEGIRLMSNAGDKTKLNGVVIAYGGLNEDNSAGLYVDSQGGKTVKFQLSNSLIMGAAQSGMEFYGNVQMRPESTGNLFAGNGWPIRLEADSIGYIPAGQAFENNDRQAISVWFTTSDTVTRTATWRNHGVPYSFANSVYIGGTASPVVTIEPGTELRFQQNATLEVGYNGAGTLVAVGQAGKPITFTSEIKRAGAWEGLHFTGETGDSNKLENVVIENANIALNLDVDLGGFIRNATIRNSAEMGIYRGYGSEGTTFLSGFGIQFEGNAVDENEE